ncbi:hypothetical protein ZWY2020_046397 [Hordeum vulgare]|nr:hypothetical protein ZWY2020_046397 [Hordeum vulgare]
MCFLISINKAPARSSCHRRHTMISIMIYISDVRHRGFLPYGLCVNNKRCKYGWICLCCLTNLECYPSMDACKIDCQKPFAANMVSMAMTLLLYLPLSCLFIRFNLNYIFIYFCQGLNGYCVKK